MAAFTNCETHRIGVIESAGSPHATILETP